MCYIFLYSKPPLRVLYDSLSWHEANISVLRYQIIPFRISIDATQQSIIYGVSIFPSFWVIKSFCTWLDKHSIVFIPYITVMHFYFAFPFVCMYTSSLNPVKWHQYMSSGQSYMYLFSIFLHVHLIPFYLDDRTF